MTTMFRINKFAAICGAAAIAAAFGIIAAASRPQTPAQTTPAPPKVEKQTATLAAGCFWSMEAIFKQLKGVDKVVSGYAGGKLTNPSYEDVATGNTGHAETINITFDPSKITFKDLLDVMLTMRDPTTLNRQGNDEGTEYRSVIFYRNEEQHKDALAMIKKFNDNKVWPDKIVTAVTPFSNFYPAEQYHVDYYRLHPDQPYCRLVIAPEIADFRARFRSKLKQ
jgi:peptide-methionine (S)-S-oxide reductase